MKDKLNSIVELVFSVLWLHANFKYGRIHILFFPPEALPPHLKKISFYQGKRNEMKWFGVDSNCEYLNFNLVLNSGKKVYPPGIILSKQMESIMHEKSLTFNGHFTNWKEFQTLSCGKETDICSQSVDSSSVESNFPLMGRNHGNDTATASLRLVLYKLQPRYHVFLLCG